MWVTCVVLLALAARAYAGPINIQHGGFDDNMNCATSCPESSKFQYVIGTTYQYDYDVHVDTTMENAYEDNAKIDISAIVNIEILSKCEFSMKLHHVKIVNYSEVKTPLSSHFKMALEKNLLRFSFQDGVIPTICPAEGEEKWTVNFKRGVLSTIQNSMDNVEQDQKTKESDVSGECATDYKVLNRGWYSTTVTKSKDLIGCSSRHGYQSSIHAMPYSASSKIQSVPLMKSTIECEQELDKSGFLKGAKCKEVHVFRPFSNENSGAVTKVSQKLTITGQIDSVSIGKDLIQSRLSMLFEHRHHTIRSDNRRDIIAKLDEICTATMVDIGPEVPEMFSQLISVMKNLESDVIRDVYKEISENVICKENNKRIRAFYLDAIPMAGTAAATRILKEMILNKEVSSRMTKMWLMSLAFIQDPGTVVLHEAKTLLDNPETSLQAMLPVSTLVNNYCRQHKSCADEDAVKNIIHSLLKHIGQSCIVDTKNIAYVLQALRALGNAGQIVTMTRSLSQCFLMTVNPDEVKSAALQAYRRLPCFADRSDVVNVFKDSSLDSELRIQAYLTIMECVDDNIISAVKNTLMKETDSQVGSFVWSHISNLMESSSPHKQYMKTLLKDVSLLKEFDLEKIKFSRNYEGSVFIDKFNTGALVDSNVIWSGKSFAPRSAMINVTVDLFGKSVNLFEIGARLEGLEYLLETYLGPYGYFNNKKPKRSFTKSKEDMDQLKASGYVRMFGNELSFMRMQGVDEMKGFNFLKFIIDLSTNHDYSFTQSVSFLDSSLVIPSGCGLPLSLTVNGAATIDLKASGRIDLRKVHTSPRSLLVDGIFQPSASIQLKGIMSVDAFATTIGMKVMNMWHSSIPTRGRLELKRGKVLSLEFDMPQDKIEILDVKSSFFSILGESEKSQNMLDSEQNFMNVCSGSRLAKVSGLELCLDINYVNASLIENSPYFPFTGPFSLGISLNKRDKHIGYNMLAKRTESKTSSILQFAFDTPGSNIDRTLGFDLSLNYKKKKVDMSFVSPWKNVAVKGSMTNDNTNLAISGSVEIDDSKVLAFTTQMLTTKKKSVVTYKPTLEIHRSGKENIMFSGILVVDGKRKSDIDISMAGITNNTITLKSTLMNTKTEKGFTGVFGLSEKETYAADIGLIVQDKTDVITMFKIIPTFVIRSPTKTLISLTGSADFKQNKSLKSFLSLSVARYMNKPTTVKCNWRKLSGKRVRHNAALIITSKYASAKITGLLEQKAKGTASRITVDYNLPFLKEYSKNRVAFSTKLTERSTKTLFKQKYNVNLDMKRNPDLNFDTTVDVSHNNRITDVSMKMQYGRNYKDNSKKLISLIVVRHKWIKTQATISYIVKSQWPEQKLNIQVKGNHKHDKKYLKSTVTLKSGKSKYVDISLDLKDLSTELMKKNIEFTYSYPGNDINFKSSIIQLNQKHYQHNADLKMGKSKSSILTTYTHPMSNVFEASSDIILHNMKPIHLSGMVGLDRDDFKASIQLATRGKIYSANSIHKYSKQHGIKCILDVAYPERHIAIISEGKRTGNNSFEAKLDIKWDADNDPKQNIVFISKTNFTSLYRLDSTLTLKYPERTVKLNFKTGGQSMYAIHLDCSWQTNRMISVDTAWDYINLYPELEFGTSLRIMTPFSIIKDLEASINVLNNEKNFASVARYTMNNKKYHFDIDMNVEKPISFRKVAIIINTTSSLKRINSATLLIYYDYHDILKCNIQSSLEKIKTEMSIVAKSNKNDMINDMETTVKFSSNIPSYEKCKFNFKFSDNKIMFTTNIVLEINNKFWLSDLNMNYTLLDWKLQNSGKILLSAPYIRFVSKWNHVNTENSVKTEVISNWGNSKQFYLNVEGNHKPGIRSKTSGNIKIQTPWTKVKQFEADLENEFGYRYFHSASHIKKEGENKVVTNIYYSTSDTQTDFNIRFIAPFLKQMNLNMNSVYTSYPFLAHLDLEWSPKDRLTVDASLTPRSLSDISSYVRITTPLKGYKIIILKAENSKHGSEWMSTSSIEYGLNKMVKLEARMQAANLKKFWIKLETRFKNYKKMHAGIQYEFMPNKFNSKVELVVNPLIGKYSGILHWDAEEDFSCKCKVEIPLALYPYFEMAAKSTKGRKGRNSRIELVYAPNKSFVLASTHKFTDNLLLDISLNTPFENYTRMAFNFKHSFGRQKMVSHIEAGRSSYKLSADVKLKWNKEIDGILVIKTPLEGFKISKISFKQSGKPINFKSQCEIQIEGEKIIQITAEILYNQKISGMFSVRSKKFNDIKLSFDHRGSIADCTGSISLLKAGHPLFDAFIQNLFTSQALDTELNVRSSYFDEVRLTIDHIGDHERFSTKITGSLGNENSFLLDTKFHQTQPVIDFNTLLTYTTDGNAKNAGFLLYKDGSLRSLMTKVSGHINKQYINIKTSLVTEGLLDASVDIQTPFTNFHNIGMSVKYRGQRNAFVAENYIQYMDDKYIQSRISNKADSMRTVDFKVEMETLSDYYILNHNHILDEQSLMSETAVNNYKILTEANLQYGSFKHADIKMTISTPLENYKSINLQHYHNLNEDSFTCTWAYNKYVMISKLKFPHFELKNVDVVMEVTTPFLGYESSVVKHTHQLNGTVFTSNTQYNDQAASSVIRCEHYISYVETSIEIKNPVTAYEDIIFRHKHQIIGKSVTINTEAKYGEAMKGNLNISIHLKPFMKINGLIQTSFSVLQDVTISLEQNSGTLKCTGLYRYNDNKLIEGSTNFSVSELGKAEGQVILLTPFEGYTKSKGSVNIKVTGHGFTSKGYVIYGNGRTVSAEISGLKSDSLELNVIIKTPFVGYESSRLVFTHSGSLNNFFCHHEVEIAGKANLIDLALQYGDSTVFIFNATTENFSWKHAEISVRKLGGFRDMHYTAEMKLNEDSVKSTLSTRIEKEICAVSMTFTCPCTETIVADIEHNIHSEGFTTKISSGIGRDRHFSTFLNFMNRGNMADMNSEITYVWSGLGNQASLAFHKEGKLNDFVVNMNGKYNFKAVELSTVLKTISGVHGNLYVKTPVTNFNNIGVSFDHSGDINTFASEGRIKYMDGKEIFGKLNHYKYHWKRIETSVELHLPVINFEYTKVAYRHNSQDSRLRNNLEVSYGTGKRFTVDFQLSTYSTYDMSFVVTSSIPGYEVLEIITSFERSWKRYMLDTSLNAGLGRKFAVISIFDYSETPISTSFRISTPVMGFETVEFTATHIGELSNFRSTAAFKSAYTESIVTEITLKYQSLLKFDGMMALNSDIDSINNLKLTARNTDESGLKTSHIEIIWDPMQSILFHEMYRHEYTWDGEHITAELSLATPFKILQQSSLKIEHIRSTDKYTEKFETEYNDKSLFDIDMEYSTGARHEVSVSTRHPRPMEMTVLGYKTNHNMYCELILNWDKTNADCNIHAQMMYVSRNNKDIKIKMIHSSRTVGFTCSLKQLEKQTECQGEIILNEDKGHKMTYSFNLNQHTRRQTIRYDGSLEIGLPIRKVKLVGAFTDNNQVQTLDGSLYWDVDRNPSKEVSVRTALYLQGISKKIDVSFRLPSIDKDIRIVSEMVRNNGPTVFEGKTKISYSEDSRKKLIVTYRLDDLSDTQDGKNCSVMFGVRHLFTDVDVIMNGFAGYTPTKSFSSFDFNYFTAKKETQNFALMMETDKHRRRIDFQLNFPIKRVNITAEVASMNPYQVQVSSKVDEAEAVTAIVTVDTENRIINIKTSYDTENPDKLVELTAKYLNTTAVQVDLHHQDGLSKIVDSILALRLNSSRLLHARLLWRPDLMTAVKTYIAERSSYYGESIDMTIQEMSDAVGAEVSRKYRRITMSLSEEAKPFIALLESELIDIDRQLDDFTRQLDLMYQSNEFFIQQIGESYSKLTSYYSMIVEVYRQNYGLITHSISRFLNSLATFPVNDYYQLFIYKIIRETQNSVNEMSDILADVIKRGDSLVTDFTRTTADKYTSAKKSVSKLVNKVKDHPKIKQIQNMFDTTNYRTFVMSVAGQTAGHIKSSSITETFCTALSQIRNVVGSGLKMFLKEEEHKQLKTFTNNVYQEMLWAYKYWDVDTNVAKHLSYLLDALEEVMDEELEDYTSHIYWIQRSTITVYDPKNGEIQLEVYLPFPVNRLDKVPRFKAYFTRIVDYAAYYADKIRSLRTLDTSLLWRANNTIGPKDDFSEELMIYLNTPIITKNLKRYKMVSL